MLSGELPRAGAAKSIDQERGGKRRQAECEEIEVGAHERGGEEQHDRHDQQNDARC